MGKSQWEVTIERGWAEGVVMVGIDGRWERSEYNLVKVEVGVKRLLFDLGSAPEFNMLAWRSRAFKQSV